MSELSADLYAELRPRAFAIAYRMLGTVGEAEDIVQEAMLRLHSTLQAGEAIASPIAYVSTIVTRLAIDQLRSARARRESYVGEWLPEPLVTDTTALPADRAEQSDELSLAFLVLLESLSPAQRAAFLLREVFEYDYAEIAAAIDTSEANARQLATRARAHVRSRRPRFDASRERRDELAHRFLAAAQEGDLPALEELLARDVVMHGDGGGKVPALGRPVVGGVQVARTLIAWVRGMDRSAGVRVELAEVNGQPGLMAYDGTGRLFGVLGLDIVDGRIQAIRSIVNPDKLRHLGPVGSLEDVLRGAG